MNRIVLKSTALGIAASLLAACATTHGLHPSGQLTDQASLKSEQSLAGVTLSPDGWPKQDWWQSFGDPQLSGLIDEALKNNPDLAEVQARAQAAQAVADTAEAAREPSGELDASVIGARYSEYYAIYPSYDLGTFAWAKALMADFSWDVDLFGGKKAAWQAALGRSRAAAIETRAVRIELSVNVARAYINLGYAFAQRDVAEDEYQRASKSLALTTRLVQGGLGTTQSRNLADSQVASADQQRAQADRAIDAARSTLAVLLGEGPDRGLQIQRPHMINTDQLLLPEQMQLHLLGRRADLVAARWQVEAASKNIKAAKAAFLPDLNLSAMAGLAAIGDSAPLFQLPARQFEVAPALSLPIFDGKHLRANLSAADAEYDEAVAHYNKRLVSAVNEVADLVSAITSVRKQIALEERARRDAQKSWDDALAGYKAGVAGPLTPLTARQQLLSTQQRLAALYSQQADLTVRMIGALGGGFEDADKH